MRRSPLESTHPSDDPIVATAPTSPDEYASSTHVLTPVLSAKWALSPGQFAVVASLAGWCWYVSFIPLYHAVTWRHALVGQSITSTAKLPTADPTQSLADGMSWTTPSWLSDVGLSLIERVGGATGLIAASVAILGLTAILLARYFYLLAGRKRWMMLGLAVTAAYSFTQVGVLRPELVGGLCFAVLLLLLHQLRDRDASPIALGALPLLLCVWANLDGSVALGMIAVVCFGVGLVVDEWLDRGSILFALSDPSVRRRMWFAEASLFATLITPLGWGLWSQIVSYPSSPLWSALGGSRPLVLASGMGLGVAALWLATAVALRVSRGRFPTSSILMLLAFSLLAMVSSKLTPWLAVASVSLLLPHLAGIFESRRWIAPPTPRDLPAEGEPAKPMQFLFTLLSALVVWTAFALSPLAGPVLGGKPRPIDHVYSPETPHSVAKFLREQPPKGLVWAPDDWSDWLLWDGPPGLKIAANSNASALPRMVRSDYGQVARIEGNWTRILDRYGVEYLVIDKREQPRLADAAMSQLDAWSTAFEDERALVMRRKEAGE
ncbi:MAG: hypothetical protein U1A77_18055 [Pirellulales bacterium]